MHRERREDDVTCPYCGYEYSDSWEFCGLNTEVITCGDCGKQFNLEIYHSVTYITSTIPCMYDNTPHKWYPCQIGTNGPTEWKCDYCGERTKNKKETT